MRYGAKILALLLCLAGLAACGARYAHDQETAAGYPHRHSDFDYRVAWKGTAAPNGYRLEGLLKNVRFQNIESLELTVFLLDPNGTVRARRTTLPVPQFSRINEVVPFSLQFENVSPAPGDLLQFLIRYKGSEGGSDEDGVDWRSSFVADASTGKPVKEEGKTQQW